MRRFFTNVREVATAGFLFMLPVYVVLYIASHAWTNLSSLGSKVASLFGVKSILGVGGSSLVSSIVLIVLWVACGLLVRISVVASMNRTIESWLAKYVPGYEAYKKVAEDKLQNKVRILPYSSALVRQHDYWRPAYVVEQDNDGNYVLFVPSAPDTHVGHVLVAHLDQIRVMPSMTANQLEGSLKKLGKGLLSHAGVARSGDGQEESPERASG